MVQNNDVYLIVDESNLVKNHQAIRTKNIIRLAEKCKYKLILNGTPISRSEKDLYAQWYILDWRILGYQSFWSFEANHLEYDKNIQGKINRCLNTDYLVKKIAPYTYQVKKDECLDLPEKTYYTEYYNLTDEQDEHYSKVADIMLNKVDDFRPETIYRLFSALQNVISGYWVKTDKHLEKYKMFPNPLDNPRIQCLLRMIDTEPNNKTIIFCKYTQEIEDICEILGDKAVPFYGELNQKQRQINLDLFQGPKQFLVANKTCAGYGLNLQFCSYVIYYSNDWDYATRAQSEDRVHRIGQASNVHYVDICAAYTLDERILDCLKNKENLVNSFKEQIELQKDNKVSFVEKYIYKRDYKGRTKLNGKEKIRIEAYNDLKED
jgi:SNF2 family DNA or RNA helicase